MYDSTVAGRLVGWLDSDGHSRVPEFVTRLLCTYHYIIFQYYWIGLLAPHRLCVSEGASRVTPTGLHTVGTMNDAMTTMIVDDSENRSNEIQKMEGKEQRLGVWQLWGSLPKPCKLFLGLCIVQACVSGAFAVTELSKEDSRNLQDLILLLVSAVMFLCIVLDAFWLENAYQLLVSMASGGLNLAQLIIYSVRDAFCSYAIEALYEEGNGTMMML